MHTSKVVECSVEDCSMSIPSHSLKVLTQNIRSIGKNFDEVVILLERLKTDIDIIVLTECWLHFASALPMLDEYSCHANKVYFNQNEGVVVYAKANLAISVEEPSTKQFNCLILKNGTDCAIIAIYRSPSNKNLNIFFESLNEVLSGLATFKNLILTGDLNIDIVDDLDRNSANYLDLLSSHGLFPAHNKITRDKSNTCLDHVMLKTEEPAVIFILQSTITDHKALLTCLQLCTNKNSDKTRPFSTNKLDLNILTTNAKDLNFENVLQIVNPNSAIDLLVVEIQSLIDKSSISITVPRSKVIRKPWITSGLLKCIKNRDQLHKKAKRNPDNETVNITYRRYRTYCNNLLKRLKRNYEREQIKIAGKNSKQLWKVIKSITHTAKVKSSSHKLLKIKDTSTESVNAVNQYFASIGSSLAKQTMSQTIQRTSTSSSATPLNSFVLLDTDASEIAALITGLKTDCSVGHDRISNKILKILKPKIVAPLTHIFNSCLAAGVFPNSFKQSIICPIFKGGDGELVSNYRPIAILTALSKLLEKILNRRLTDFLEKNKLLSHNQFGFRSDRSTEDAVHELVHNVSSGLNDGKKCLAVFLDLAKAFDTVSIPLLLEKLDCLGVRGCQLDIFRDYLSNRNQRVQIDGNLSQEFPINYGVPQGSILGPTLFLVYINDLCALSLNQGRIITYADDTALIFQDNTWQGVFREAQQGLNSTNEWLRQNILTLNTNKTKYLAFSLRNSTQPASTFKLYAHQCTNHMNQFTNCNCSPLEKTNDMRYLGIIIDQNLNFKNHILKLRNRVRSLIYVFKNLRHVMGSDLLIQLYKILCQSLLNYCITSWGGALKTYLKTLEIAQRAVLKVIFFRKFWHPTELLYKEAKVLTVRQLFILSTILKQHSQLTYDPIVLERRRRDLVCTYSIRFHKASTQRFFSFFGPYLYNKLNKELSIYPLTKSKCKQTVLEWLMLMSYDTTEELLEVIS